MTLTAWKSRASKLAKAHAALQEPSPEAVRLALCELHALVLDAPPWGGERLLGPT